jgi:Protein of unknown function DUF262
MRCVPAHDFTVAKAMAWRSAIDDHPAYQREGSVWSIDKQQLFIDSLLNGYDVPKIYLHDLRGKHPTKVYAVVDGKQRLNTIWRFLTDEFALADDFRIEQANLPDLPGNVPQPLAGQRYSELDPSWKEVFRQTYLAVVLIQRATVDDIEDLFSRLNNGEPLNAAEKRNAMGGDMAALVRRVAGHAFFTDRLGYANTRYRHLELAARILAVEHVDVGGEGLTPGLRSRDLDAFVNDNRRLKPAARAALLARVTERLDTIAAVFESADPLLARQPQPLPYYLLVRSVARTDPTTLAGLRTFLDEFEQNRLDELARSDGRPDPEFIEFTHLMQHGTHEARSLARRLEILLRARSMPPAAR